LRPASLCGNGAIRGVNLWLSVMIFAKWNLLWCLRIGYHFPIVWKG
jgi:hypothetical protein